MRLMLLVAGAVLLLALVRPVPLPTPRWWPLIVVAALLQVPAWVRGGGDELFRLSYVVLCLVAWRNRTVPGGRLILAGLLLNAVPILVDGRMPISLNMLAWGHQLVALHGAVPLSKDVAVRPSLLLLLGDDIPVSVLGSRVAWSIGDVVLCCGALWYTGSLHSAAMQTTIYRKIR